LTTKSAPPGPYRGTPRRAAKAAAAEGLTYAIDKIKRQPNTLDCHRLILWAGESGNAARMKQRLMDIYFTEGGDLTEREVLVGAAADCGLDAGVVRRRLTGEDDMVRVEQAAKAAADAGINGGPCFVLGGVLGVPGRPSAHDL